MLILSRRPNEAIVIAGRIRVKVLGFSGEMVRLGIEAPREVEVDRGEVRERKDRERKERERASKAVRAEAIT